jgi:hypothetical protein
VSAASTSILPSAQETLGKVSAVVGRCQLPSIAEEIPPRNQIPVALRVASLSVHSLGIRLEAACAPEADLRLSSDHLLLS